MRFRSNPARCSLAVWLGSSGAEAFAEALKMLLRVSGSLLFSELNLSEYGSECLAISPSKCRIEIFHEPTGEQPLIHGHARDLIFGWSLRHGVRSA